MVSCWFLLLMLYLLLDIYGLSILAGPRHLNRWRITDSTHVFLLVCCLKARPMVNDLEEGQLNHFIVVSLYQQQPSGSIQTFIPFQFQSTRGEQIPPMVTMAILNKPADDPLLSPTEFIIYRKICLAFWHTFLSMRGCSEMMWRGGSSFCDTSVTSVGHMSLSEEKGVRKSPNLCDVIVSTILGILYFIMSFKSEWENWP